MRWQRLSIRRALFSRVRRTCACVVASAASAPAWAMELMLNGWRAFSSAAIRSGCADAVAEAQAGEAENLREGPHQQQIGFFAVADERQRGPPAVQEFDVSLVQSPADTCCGTSLERIRQQFLLGHNRARGVVGIRHKDDARFAA